MSEKKVTVTISGGVISVSPDPVQPKKASDNVRWESANGQFTINLPGYTISYRQEGGKYVGVSGTFPTVEKLKYTVTASGAADLDPEVDIQP